MSADYDVCVIGSGAGGGPVAYRLAEAGYSVVVLEKGPWLRETHFRKDELACCRRDVYTPRLHDEQHVVEDGDGAGGWQGTPGSESGWSFWNGNCVGGSSNFMSGYFHRMKPVDFKLHSTFGPIAGANVADWPIDYDDLEPYYAETERLVGVSGHIEPHPGGEPRSTPDLPYPPTREHPVSARIDTAAASLGYHALRVPRAILSRPAMGRRSCEYSGFCGDFGCASGAKGSARAALLDHAIATGRCEIRPHAKVSRIDSDAGGRITAVRYYDRDGTQQRVDARIYVVACQAIETSRLLLASTGPKFTDGLANNHGQVGRNLLFSGGGAGSGDMTFADFDADAVGELRAVGPFVNRALDDWYTIDDPQLGRLKGGIVEFLWDHPNAVVRAERAKWRDGELVWGTDLKRRLETWFRTDRTLNFEVFNDWLPTDDCFVALDGGVRDRWGDAVARVRIGAHPHDQVVGRFLAERGEQMLRQLDARRISSSISASPPPNLQAGGCRFGHCAQTSVLDPDCRTHEVDNLFVSDGSFMPTGGSVPYTFTIYANSFRVADRVIQQLGGPRNDRFDTAGS
ncbi:MAG: GMC family oxidoreductase [Chromatiaceae bacterium]|nr:GMC family oxidoreductase [Gammaproteobacteria bacterium]MCP5301053.1 GMC family oxidoreductase [Chromatiaceae bacterium]MCP5421475.1 GMC family oxidoreductase [Chromatiaceae bacterium]